MRRGRIVSHSVYPGPYRTATIESLETAPQGDVDFLDQIEARRGICLVATRQAGDGGPKLVNGFAIELIGRSARREECIWGAHIPGSLRGRAFLTHGGRGAAVMVAGSQSTAASG